MVLQKNRIILDENGVSTHKYPIINKQGIVQRISTRPSPSYAGKSMVESILSSVAELGQLTEKQRLKVPNSRIFIDGWRELTDREYAEWMEKGKPYRLHVSISVEKEKFNSQLEEKDQAIEALKKQIAELSKAKEGPKDPMEKTSKEPKSEGKLL